MMMTPVGVVFPVFRRRSRLVAPPAWTYIALSDEGKAMTDTAIDTAARPEELGTLPEWDLRDLYSDPDSPELQADLERAAADASAFASAHKGRLAGYDGDALAAAIAAYEALDERLSRIVSRSEEHTSELQSLMRISYAVFCLKKKNNHQQTK